MRHLAEHPGTVSRASGYPITLKATQCAKALTLSHCIVADTDAVQTGRAGDDPPMCVPESQSPRPLKAWSHSLSARVAALSGSYHEDVLVCLFGVVHESLTLCMRVGDCGRPPPRRPWSVRRTPVWERYFWRSVDDFPRTTPGPFQHPRTTFGALFATSLGSAKAFRGTASGLVRGGSETKKGSARGLYLYLSLSLPLSLSLSL